MLLALGPPGSVGLSAIGPGHVLPSGLLCHPGLPPACSLLPGPDTAPFRPLGWALQMSSLL